MCKNEDILLFSENIFNDLKIQQLKEIEEEER